MNPVRVTPPDLPVVELQALKDHLRVVHNDEDSLIASLEAQAVAHLDGYRGILGRCIMPQTWRETFGHWGNLRLALPDVTEATVTYLDAAGDEHPAEASELHHDALGAYVVASGPQASRVIVTYDCELPADALPTVQAAVKLHVAMNYEDREGGDAARRASFERAFQAQIACLRRVVP